MSISPSKARSLCTESEYNLVKWSSPRSVKTLSPSKLKDKIDRARRLRDKFRDLAKKQRGEARGKRKPTGARAAQGNERTVLKAELFDQTLDRFQKALERAEASDASSKGKSSSRAARSGGTGSKKSVKKAAKKSSAKKTSSKKSASKKSSQKKSTRMSAKAAPAGQTAPSFSLAAPSVPSRRGTNVSLGLSSRESSFTGLGGLPSPDQQSRETRRRDASRTSKIGREDSRFARTAREKIQGHVSAQTRRSQAKRDSKGG